MHDSKSNKKCIHGTVHRYRNHFLNGGKHTVNTSMKIPHKLFCIYCTLLLLHTEQWKRFWWLRKQDAKCTNWNWYKTYRCKIHCWHKMHRVASVPLLIMYSLLFPKIGLCIFFTLVVLHCFKYAYNENETISCNVCSVHRCRVDTVKKRTQARIKTRKFIKTTLKWSA